MAGSDDNTFRAGAARVDITPLPGVQLAGDIGRFRPTEEIRDRLHANALVLETRGERICLLSLDLLGVTKHWSDEIRQRASARFGLNADHVVVHAVQNHAAPSLGHFFVKDECRLIPAEHLWLRGGDDAYHEPTTQKCVQAIGEVTAKLEPVSVRVGRGIDGRVASNRRFIMRDGSAVCHPAACDPDILHVEGPTDPEVGVMTFVSRRDETVAALLHHTCHPCHGYPHRFVIGDWPGAWSQLMRKACGDECVALVINGCCGNIHHGNPLDPDSTSEYRRMAGLLMETTTRVLTRMETIDATPLNVERTVLRLPLRKLTDEVIAAAQAIVDEHPQPRWLDEDRTRVDWDWMYAVATLDLKDTQDHDPACDYEIQAFRLGDAALVTVMGEPFVEGQLKIKLKSPAPHTFVAHFCNGFAGYVPTREAMSRGGYETRTANWSQFQPDALDAIADAAGDLLRKAVA